MSIEESNDGFDLPEQTELFQDMHAAVGKAMRSTTDYDAMAYVMAYLVGSFVQCQREAYEEIHKQDKEPPKPLENIVEAGVLAGMRAALVKEQMAAAVMGKGPTKH